MGFSIGGIPPTHIQAWCDLHGITDEDERRSIAVIVGILDQLYIKLTAKSEEAKAKRKK